jgi:aspartyl-tRNA(Asn)/glutamyl-tRNA(Gln) amidotransferase subunit A
MDEFACGSDGTRSAFGPTHNPWDLERVPGGSSSGSGAAVASGMCDLALGSDTGGSIRCPSCFCGIFGLKPTYGLVSRYGLLDMAMSLEQIGPMARDTYGVALLLDIIAGKDPKDPTTIEKPEKDYTSFVENFDESKLKGRKVAYAKEFIEYTNEDVKKVFFETLDYLNSLGLEIEEISLPEVHYAIPTYYLVVFSEFSSAMQKYDGLKYGYRCETQDLWQTIMKSRAIFGEEVKRRIILGTYITSREQFGKWYKKAVLVRMKIRKRVLSLFKEYDYLVSPTMPNIPWKIGEKSKDPLEMYQEDVLTVLTNICGTPAASVPMGSVDGLPTGFQIISDYFSEPKILELMRAIEQRYN